MRARYRLPDFSRPGRILLAAALAASCGGEDKPRPELARIPIVEAVPARSGRLPLSERVSGIVKAENQVEIRAELETPIVQVHVRSGESVRRGQPLVRHRDTELRDQLRQAEAAVKLAQASSMEARAQVSELEAQATRTRALAVERLISRMALETLEAQLSAARANADRAAAQIEQARATAQERRSALAKAVVRAPVAGRVGQRNAEVGMIPGPDTLLFVVGDLDDLIIEVPLTQEMLAEVGEGDPVRIGSPALGAESLRATISRISPFLSSGSFTTVGEIDISQTDRRLRPGMFVTVDILYGETDPATLVPSSAIWEDPNTGRPGIFVVPAMTQNRTAGPGAAAVTRPVAHRPVEVVAEGGGAAGVRGLREGDWVVVVGQHLLARDSAAAARVRPTTWERVMELQGLQREDLLREFLDKQQRLARTEGSEPPDSAEYLRAGGPAAESPVKED